MIYGIYLYIVLQSIFVSKKDIKTTISINDSYLLRGMAISFIVLHHIAQRFSNIQLVHIIILIYDDWLVGLFFFLSGYGNYISLKKSKTASKWLLKRIFTILCYFIFGLLLNLVLNFHLYTSFQTFVLDLITVTYKPYTLWYLKVLICFYIFTYIFNRLFKNQFLGTVIISILTIIYTVLCFVNKVEPFWWTSAICYPFGLFIAQKTDFVQRISKKKIINIFLAIFLLLTLLLVKYDILHPISSVVFCYFVYLFLCNRTLGDNILMKFLGKTSFGLYLYHIIFITFCLKLFGNIEKIFPILIILIGSIVCSAIVYILTGINKHNKKITS